MSKIAFCADVHVDNYKAHGGALASGVNERCRLVLDALRTALLKAEAAGVRHLFVLGDLFNDVRPPPQIIAAVQEVLYESHMHVHLLVGNHDRVSTAPGDHALGPLIADMGDASVQVVEAPGFLPLALDGGQVDVFAVPFLPGKASDVVRDFLASEAGKAAAGGGGLPARRRLLVLHYGIADKNTPAYLADGHDALPASALLDLAEKFPFNAVFAGHWHQRREWSRKDGPVVMQVGALAPRGWNDAGLHGYGTLVFYDPKDDAVEYTEIEGPRFCEARSYDELCRVWKDATFPSKLYVRRYTQPDESIENVSDDPKLVVEVLPDLTEATVATRSAAIAARSSASLDEALGAYVSAMSLPDDVKRTDVLARTRAYLEGRR